MSITSIISKEDRRFLTEKAMPYFGVKALKIEFSTSRKKYPDIWISFNQVPIITVTDEWKKQSLTNRRSRLTHELLHIFGMEHDESIGYSTFPARDKFSMRVYKHILGGRL